MRHAVIKDGVVTNIVIAPEGWAPEGVHTVASDTAQKDFVYDGATFAPPPVPVPTKDALLREVKRFRDVLRSGGKTVDVAVAGGTPKPVYAATNAAGMSDLADAVALAQATGQATIWTAKGATLSLTPTEVANLRLGLIAFQQKVRGAAVLVAADVTAGTLTAAAAIAADPNWPVGG